MSDLVDDAAIEAALWSLLDRRASDATICPSEVARAVGPSDGEGWRDAMPQVRRVAARLAGCGALRVTRSGRDVDALAPGGPIRLGRPRP